MRTFLLALLAFSSISFGAAPMDVDTSKTRLELLREQAVLIHSIKAIIFASWDAARDATGTTAGTADGVAAGDAAAYAAWNATGGAAGYAATYAAWDATRDAARDATAQRKSSHEIGLAAWQAAEQASWAYIQENLYQGEMIWHKVTTATRAALEPFGEDQFPALVFVFSSDAGSDPRMPYFAPFVEKILEVTDPLKKFTAEEYRRYLTTKFEDALQGTYINRDLEIIRSMSPKPSDEQVSLDIEDLIMGYTDLPEDDYVRPRLIF